MEACKQELESVGEALNKAEEAIKDPECPPPFKGELPTSVSHAVLEFQQQCKAQQDFRADGFIVHLPQASSCQGTPAWERRLGNSTFHWGDRKRCQSA